VAKGVVETILKPNKGVVAASKIGPEATPSGFFFIDFYI
jgi:hypothetical protein